MPTPLVADETSIAKYRKAKAKLNDKAALLEATKWVPELNWDQMQTLADFLDIYEFPKGTTIFEEGATEEYLGIIARGAVRILKQDSRGSNKTITILRTGSSFGEMSLIDGSPRSAAALATENLSLLVLAREQFELLLDKKSKLGIIILTKLAKAMSLRLRQTSAKLVEYLISS